jgi:S-adenosylmethionine synthetase
MIRISEAVLRGHPDKFCDRIADRILLHAYEADPDAYGQIEVAVWSDQIYLTGATVTRAPIHDSFADIVQTVGREIGYTPGNSIDANRYVVHDHVCRLIRDPREWTRHVNDQSVVIGWAGYDARTCHLPPEHFLAHSLRGEIENACESEQPLAGHGPDGKLVVRIDEIPATRAGPAEWRIDTVLLTLQQKPGQSFMDFQSAVAGVILAQLRTIADQDRRWRFDRDHIRILINPNGPFFDGGSNSDNGQTGRKLAMDYYGPRIPIGGGALCGKDWSHIDRAGACAARHACVQAVAQGAPEAMVRITYAPGLNEPLDVTWTFPNGGRPPADARFDFESIRALTRSQAPALRSLSHHFTDTGLPWNRP